MEEKLSAPCSVLFLCLFLLVCVRISFLRQKKAVYINHSWPIMINTASIQMGIWRMQQTYADNSTFNLESKILVYGLKSYRSPLTYSEPSGRCSGCQVSRGMLLGCLEGGATLLAYYERPWQSSPAVTVVVSRPFESTIPLELTYPEPSLTSLNYLNT